MRAALGGPRLLLRRLREVMAEPVGAQARLDKIVTQIAFNMVAEVCSVYVLRADGALELFATEGLKREAVHLTTMQTGEGLVGLIAATAEPLALSDAQKHPSFSYKPETGEEIYSAFLGVPILRGGRTLGVLVVQNRARRAYSEEEVEALQTTSMLLAEMVATGELQAIARPGAEISFRGPASLKGAPVVEGVGLGHVVLHQPRVHVTNIIADDMPREARRLDEALAAMRASLDHLIASSEGSGPGEHQEVLATFRMFADDKGWMRRLHEAILTGITAEAAVERVQNDARAKLQRQKDPYLRERLHDLDDLANRLLHQLTGQALTPAHDQLPENSILVARTMGPAALLDYQRARLRGLVMEEGSASSHAAIVARALGIPVVGEAANITNLVDGGDAIILDGATGEIHLRPKPDVVAAYAEKARLGARRQEQYREARLSPAQTLDGVDISLSMNAGLLIDVPQVEATNAASIGLFRTELQFMVAPHFPRLEAQAALYRSVLDGLPGHQVIFRTLDIGGDKVLPYMRTHAEENPALGWRAIRIGLDRPALLRMQLRALLTAGAGRQLNIMLPMIAAVEEIDAARDLLSRELKYCKARGYPLPHEIRLGVMVEVPSLLWQLEEVLARVDFLSVGSNDLAQYFFAADRDNARVSTRFDSLSAPFLRALKHIADAGRAAGKPVALCGEMGGKPLEAMALIGIGYRNLSMSPSSIGPVKAMVRSLRLQPLENHLRGLLAGKGAAAPPRQNLAEFAAEQGVQL